MAESHLIYRLEGDISEIDIFRLAPTLLALGELIRDANHELFPDGRDIGVNVKPFREGSFVVDLTLFSPSNFQKLIDFLTPHSLEQLEALLTSIGLVAGGVGTSVMGAVQAIKFLKGKPKSVDEIAPGQIRYTANNGSSVTVDSSVHSLLSNASITQNIYNIYGPPMADQPSIKDIRTYIEGHEESAVTVDRDELPLIQEFAEGALDSSSEPQESKDITHHDVLLNPKRGSFGNDPKDWSFWKGDAIITATIKDKEFLAEYASGNVRLNESDLLTVELVEHRRVVGTRVQKSTYDIIQVTDYKKGPTQPRLIP